MYNHLDLDSSTAQYGLNVSSIGDNYTISGKAGNGIEGIMTLTFTIWDRFHINSTTSISLTIYFVSTFKINIIFIGG